MHSPTVFTAYKNCLQQPSLETDPPCATCVHPTSKICPFANSNFIIPKIAQFEKNPHCILSIELFAKSSPTIYRYLFEPLIRFIIYFFLMKKVVLCYSLEKLQDLLKDSISMQWLRRFFFSYCVLWPILKHTIWLAKCKN